MTEQNDLSEKINGLENRELCQKVWNHHEALNRHKYDFCREATAAAKAINGNDNALAIEHLGIAAGHLKLMEAVKKAINRLEGEADNEYMEATMIYAELKNEAEGK